MEKTEKVKRTERGWPGHYCCSHRCIFRRNTLLEYGDIKIVISTVGLLLDELNKNKNKLMFERIASNRYFETMAFHASLNGRYLDADIQKIINFESPWYINEIDADDRANEMHEAVILEISEKLSNGEKFLIKEKTVG